jgi:hypothetical protein
MGTFWNKCKSNKKCDNQPYDKLLKNEILKNDYEKKRNYSKNKDVTPLTKVVEFLEIMKDRNKIISQSQKDKEILFSDKTPMCSFWMVCKREKKCDNPPFFAKKTA